MKGHVKKRGDRFYAVIYEGLDPVTGKEIRRWHPAGTDRAAAERLAVKLAKAEEGRTDTTRSLTFGAFLVRDWLPAKKLQLATTTYAAYARNVVNHVLPALGRIRLRRITHTQVEALYDNLLTPSVDRPALAHKTVYEVHLVIRGSLTYALRRGLVTKNVALVARSPLINAARRPEARAWTEEELQRFLRAAHGHRFFPLLWLTAMTGMRRNEVLGLKWDDVDFKRQRLSLNRGLVAVGYELHQTRGKTRKCSPADRSRHDDAVDPRGVADTPARRGGSRRCGPRRVGVHRRRRPAGAPACGGAGVRADRPPCWRAGPAPARAPPHPRHPAAPV